MPSNIEDEVLYAQPTSGDERVQVAEACVLHLNLSIPTVVDDLANSTDRAYAALPDRLCLVGTDGRVVYKSGPGPWGFKPDELEMAITGYLASPGLGAVTASEAPR